MLIVSVKQDSTEVKGAKDGDIWVTFKNVSYRGFGTRRHNNCALHLGYAL